MLPSLLKRQRNYLRSGHKCQFCLFKHFPSSLISFYNCSYSLVFVYRSMILLNFLNNKEHQRERKQTLQKIQKLSKSEKKIQILPTPKVTVYSNEPQIYTVILLSEAYFFSARLLQHEKYGTKHQSMKLHYVNFIYLGSRKEVNLDFSTVNKYSKFAPAQYYSFFIFVLQLCPTKRGVFLKNYCRYLRIHFGKDLPEENLYGLRQLTAVMGEVLDLQPVPVVLFPGWLPEGSCSLNRIYGMFPASFESPSELPKCHVLSSSLINVFCMSFILSLTEEGPCDTVLLQDQSLQLAQVFFSQFSFWKVHFEHIERMKSEKVPSFHISELPNGQAFTF